MTASSGPGLVTVIVPFFNAAAFLEDCLRCIFAQTYRPLEVILVDDASTDGGRALVERWAALHPEIRLLINPVNRGPSFSRNRAIDMAQGTHVALLDADDHWAPDRLACLVATAALHKADMVADNVMFVRDSVSPPWQYLLDMDADAVADISLEAFLRGNSFRRTRSLGVLQPLISVDFLRRGAFRYCDGLRFSEDFHLYLRMLAAGAHFVVLGRAMYRYRFRPGAASLTAAKMPSGLARLAAELKEVLEVDIGPQRREAYRLGQRHLAALTDYMTYMRMIEPAKRGRYGGALARIVRKPGRWPLVARYLSAALVRRYQGWRIP